MSLPEGEPRSEAAAPEGAVPENGSAVAEAWPEPGPRWTEAFADLMEAWPIHVYVFGTLFLVVAIQALMNLRKTCTDLKTMRKRIITVSLNANLFVLGSTRAIVLYLDAYGAKGTVPFKVTHMIWAVGFPCITASFTLMLLVLQDTTKATVGPPRFQKFSTISVFLFAHFTLVIASEVLVQECDQEQTKVMLVICQCIFVLWSLCVTIGYILVAKKIRQNFSATLDNKWAKSDGGENAKILRLTRVMNWSAVVATFLAATHLYGAFGVFGVYSDVTFVETWPWWTFQTLLRFEEIMVSFLIFSLAAKTPSSDQKGLAEVANMITNMIFFKKNVLLLAEADPNKTMIELSSFDTSDYKSDRGFINLTRKWLAFGKKVKPLDK